ncbi:hypothetical protein [Pedobacter yulinensis]|uniref:hypothetical protein n=1 Tax=Pedobacter yulinensis TaxID=2126353 RepID=UPI0013A66529|nr:hypothetical protein [Pedobacter yulinensis]
MPRYVSSRDELVEMANFEAVSHPLTDLANSRRARKRERMRVLIDLNKRSWELAVRLMDEMKQPMVAGFDPYKHSSGLRVVSKNNKP